MKKQILVKTLGVLLLAATFNFSYAQDSANTKPAKQVAVGQAQPSSYAKPPAAPNVDSMRKMTGLSQQYQYVITKFYHYQQPIIAALWKNVTDSLKAERNKLKAATAQLAEQGKAVDSVKSQLNTSTQNLNQANERQNSISFLGIYLSKGTYNSVMWGAVGALAVALLVVILRTSGAGREAKYRTKLYEELSEEFQTYKVKANEKEKKLARELQTERNKVDELMGRG
ncbi:hypothetical protein C8P68_102695 [Mucilaginibacter yixingensis]|uniref:Uncharacterized protein n=1 Tax=Mucilaginibacter yixingensis TaxID=1295612 RepID=A0A2T5JDY9_9SPHI|nr:hypothetical protein [Mucilaginibacter yixingensis]PTQ99865.1 hypothetical protein C8P68_102695 [Mucilaginibacter yixingensis]